MAARDFSLSGSWRAVARSAPTLAFGSLILQPAVYSMTTLTCASTAIIVAVASVPLQTRAQAPDTATLTAMVISATKTPTPRSTLTQAVTVLSGEELRARGITRVVDALRSVPGASLVQNGAAGSVATFFLRGGESR